MPPTPQLGHLAQELVSLMVKEEVQETRRNLARTHPERQPPGDGLKTAKHHLNPGSNLAKNPPPQRAEVTSLNPLKEKKQAPARRQKTRRHLAGTHPERQPPSDGLKTAKHHLNPGSNLAKNHPPQRAEVTSLNPLKEKKQAPARRQKTRRHPARTHPERQPPSDGLKTAKHHLNPGSNLAKNHPPQRAEVTSLNPLKEKKQAPARRQKTRRHLARTHPERQPPSDGLKTAKHHLNPGSNLAKNPPPQRAEVTSLNPLKEKKQAPARRQKTRRHLARTHPARQPPGDGLKTAKHHLNPGSNLAKNPPPQRAEVTSLNPLKEKKQAPARRQKTRRNLARTRPERQPPSDGLKTAKHHLNPGSNLAKNPPPQRAEVTSLNPLKEKKQAPARRQKTRRHLARTHPARQPPSDGLKTAKHHLNPGSNLAKNHPPQRAEVTSLNPLKEKKQAPARRQKTRRHLARTHPERQPPGDGLKTAKHHLNPGSNLAKNHPPQRAEVTSLNPLKEKKQAPARNHKTRRHLARTHPERQPPSGGLKTAKHHLNPGSNLAKNPSPQRAEVTSLNPLKEKKQSVPKSVLRSVPKCSFGTPKREDSSPPT